MDFAMSYDASNPFAKILRGELPCFKIYEDDQVLSFLDIFPQAKGHALVIPKCEAVELSDLSDEYALAVFKAAKKVMKAQREVLETSGIVQMQLNHADAGQTVFHYHLHLIPSSVAHLSEHGKHSKPSDMEVIKTLSEKLKAHIDAQA